MIAPLLMLAAASAGDDPAAACSDLLSRTRAAMEARPPMKEELATGLMWIRLDAETALAEGDAATCLMLAREAADLLGVD